MADAEKTLTIGAKISASFSTAMTALARGFSDLISRTNRGFEAAFGGLAGLVTGNLFSSLTSGFQKMMDRWEMDSRNRNLMGGAVKREVADIDAFDAKMKKLALSLANMSGETRQNAMDALMMAKGHGVAADQLEAVARAGAAITANNPTADLKSGVEAVALLTRGHAEAIRRVVPEYEHWTNASNILNDVIAKMPQRMADAATRGEGLAGTLAEIRAAREAHGHWWLDGDITWGEKLSIIMARQLKDQTSINEAAEKGREIRFQSNALLQTEFTTMTGLARAASLRALGAAGMSSLHDVRDQNRTLAGNAGPNTEAGLLSQILNILKQQQQDQAIARSYANGS